MGGKHLRWAVAALACWPVLATTPALAQATEIEAIIDDRDVARSSDDRPVELDPDRQQVIVVTIRNPDDAPLAVRSIRVRGEVIGLTFFSYDTRVGMQVPPGGADERRFELDLFGLDGQAVGLIGSQVVALDEEREPVAAVDMVADVKGSLRSVYGVFGLTISGFTLVTFADVLIRLRRRRLPKNRWARATRFLTPGFGLGLSLIFTLSALRIYHPTTGKWATLFFGAGAIFFFLGYLTPAPPEEEEAEDEIVTDGAVVGPALAGMPSSPVRPLAAVAAGQPAPAAMPAVPPPPRPAVPASSGTMAAAPPGSAARPNGTVAAAPPPSGTTAAAPPKPEVQAAPSGEAAPVPEAEVQAAPSGEAAPAPEAGVEAAPSGGAKPSADAGLEGQPSRQAPENANGGVEAAPAPRGTMAAPSPRGPAAVGADSEVEPPAK